jgi:Protein of unknown function (DUF3828)
MGGVCRRAILLAFCTAAAMAFGGPAQAQGASPKAFVEQLYKPYLKKGFKGVDYSKPAILRRYFEPALAAAIIKDQAAAAKRSEVPTLNGDPFIDAQDWEIANLKIDVNPAGGKASAAVAYTNFNEPRTVTLDLVKTAAGWRIAEIKAPSGSLRELFKLK